MDVVHQIFKVGIDRSLSVDGGLLVRQHVVELDYAYRNDLVLLRVDQGLFKLGVHDYLLDDHSDEMVALSYVPPVIAELGRVPVVPQALNS